MRSRDVWLSVFATVLGACKKDVPPPTPSATVATVRSTGSDAPPIVDASVSVVEVDASTPDAGRRTSAPTSTARSPDNLMRQLEAVCGVSLGALNSPDAAK